MLVLKTYIPACVWFSLCGSLQWRPKNICINSTSAWSGNSNEKKGNEIYNLIMQIFDYNLIWWLSYYERNTLKIYLYNASIIAGRDLLPGTVLSQHNYEMPFTFASGYM